MLNINISNNKVNRNLVNSILNRQTSYMLHYTVQHQSNDLTSSDKYAVEVRLVDALPMSQEEKDARIIFYMYKENSPKSFFERKMIMNT